VATIRILHLEDDRFDAELITSTLSRDGLDFEVVSVDTREDFVAAFEGETFDLILADYSLPSIDGLSALKIVRGRDSNIPFILVSGTLGEEVAVGALKAGATDYVLKNNLARLAPVVRRALEEAAALVEHLRSTEKLRTSQERLRHIIENSVDLFYSHTADHVLTYLSPQCRDFLDCSSEEAMTRWTEFTTDNPVNMRGREFTQRAIETGERQPPYELEVTALSGRVLWVEVREAPVVRDGRTIAIVGSLHNITERKLARRALESSEERYRDLVEMAGVAIVVDDEDGRIQYFNQHFIGLFGFPRNELDEKLIWDFVHPDDIAEVHEMHRRRPEGDMTVHESYAFRGVRKDGRVIHLEVVATPLIENGRLAGTRSYLRDVTDRQRLEEELAQMQKLEALGQLAGGIAHDFNNLLMSISGSAELLGIRFSDEGPESQELTTIRAAVNRGAELTQRLLAIARQQVFKMEATDLAMVLGKECNILRRVIPENIKIDFLPATDLPLVVADQGQLGQVLMNLVVNARDAMPDGGTITIGVERTYVGGDADALRHPGVTAGSYVCLSVKDTGTGINAATLTHIFEPFFTTKPPGEGTGMGLATVYGIVKQHKGFIEVASEPGEGTGFEIHLPVGDEPPAIEREPARADAVGGNETIMVVEDEAEVRGAIVEMLKILGHTVFEAEDGRQALGILESGTAVDLVVSDVVMPKMGGKELLDGARRLKPRLAFIFVSAYTDRGLRDLLKSEKQTSFIGKPFTMAALSHAVRRALGGGEPA